ncbi:unnamed protein product, partial [Rangifer tarandus platyrhynchus]
SSLPTPTPPPPQETIKQISELHLQDDSEAPVSTGPEEADIHFPTEPFMGLRVS